MKLRCLYCSKEFTSYQSRQKVGKGKFCSRNCWHLYYSKECICRYCGKKYRNPISQKGDKYCSQKCYFNSEEFKNRGKLLSILYSKRVKTKCLHCKKELKIPPSRIKGGRGKYCSLECRNLGYSLPKEIFAKNRRRYSKKYRKAHRDWYIAIKQKRRALASGFGGVFTKEQWGKLKKKCSHSCPYCDKKEPKIKLTVDHVIPLAKWSEWIKKNKVNYKWNDIQNIQPLCGRCNSKKWSKLEA